MACFLSLAATEVDTAPSASTELRKPAPNPGARPYREQLQALIRDRYPQLGIETTPGIPVLTVLFDLYGEIVRSELEFSTRPPAELAASEESFAHFGTAVGDLQYVADPSFQTAANTMFVIFGGLGSRQLDRSLVQRFFPQIVSGGASLNQGIWILFDHQGRVLRTGQEQFAPGSLSSVLESRYPGIRTADLTATPVVGQDSQRLKDPRGRPLQLTCLWLAADSPPPSS